MKENLKFFIVFLASIFIVIVFTTVLGIKNTEQLALERKQREEQLALEQKQREEQLALEQELRKKQAEKELRQSLQKELEFLNKPFDLSLEDLMLSIVICGGGTTLKSNVERMTERAKIIQNGLNSDNTEIQDLAKTIRPKAIAYQLKAFPILRKAYAKSLNKELWLEDAKAYVSGKDNIYINFVSATFVYNRMIHEFHSNAYNILETLRFRQARYRYYDGGEYTYYTVYEGKDADLAI